MPYLSSLWFLFPNDRIPGFSQVFKANFQVFFIILKVTFKLFWIKIWKFHLNKNCHFTLSSQVHNPPFPANFSNLEGVALFQHSNRKQKVNSLRSTHFFQDLKITKFQDYSWFCSGAVISQGFPGRAGTLFTAYFVAVFNSLFTHNMLSYGLRGLIDGSPVLLVASRYHWSYTFHALHFLRLRKTSK